MGGRGDLNYNLQEYEAMTSVTEHVVKYCKNNNNNNSNNNKNKKQKGTRNPKRTRRLVRIPETLY